MKVTNTSNKVIGIGEVTLLPGETQDLPVAFERNPALEVYKRLNAVKISGKATEPVKTPEEIAAEQAEVKRLAAEEVEALREQRLAALNGNISEEDLGKLAEELGINPADCKDQADVLKKVKAALKK